MFQKKIKQLRLEHDMSQEDLADVLGVTRQSISKYENGTAEPSFDKLAILVGYFGVSYDDLLAADTIVKKEEPVKEPVEVAEVKPKKKPEKEVLEPTIEVVSLLDSDEESRFVDFEVVEKPAYFDIDYKPNAVLQGVPAKTGGIFKPRNVDLAWYEKSEDAYKEAQSAADALVAGKKMYELKYFVPVKKHGFFSVQIDYDAK